MSVNNGKVKDLCRFTFEVLSLKYGYNIVRNKVKNPNVRIQLRFTYKHFDIY